MDNGLTFHEDHKLRTVIWDYSGDPIPPALLADIERVAGDLDSDGACAQSLAALLDGSEVQVLRERMRRLLAEPVMPSPRTRRDLPWPWL